jgi:tRNA pseudouridine55 synthase
MVSLPELLLIDKPVGMTSFDVIRQLRRKTGIRKFGHAGTLDPRASGLLLLGVEQGTKQLASLVGLDKEYVAEVLIGERRSTGDMDGVVLEVRAYQGDVTKEEVVAALQTLTGELFLPVSAYSAIKKDGVPMYKRAYQAAQKGEMVDDVPERRMVVYEAELLAYETRKSESEDRLLLTIRFKVSSGTYIRSLAEALGSKLGYPAVLYNLRRTKVGEYRIEDAQSLASF